MALVDPNEIPIVGGAARIARDAAARRMIVSVFARCPQMENLFDALAVGQGGSNCASSAVHAAQHYGDRQAIMQEFIATRTKRNASQQTRSLHDRLASALVRVQVRGARLALALRSARPMLRSIDASIERSRAVLRAALKLTTRLRAINRCPQDRVGHLFMGTCKSCGVRRITLPGYEGSGPVRKLEPECVQKNCELTPKTSPPSSPLAVRASESPSSGVRWSPELMHTCTIRHGIGHEDTRSPGTPGTPDSPESPGNQCSDEPITFGSKHTLSKNTGDKKGWGQRAPRQWVITSLFDVEDGKGGCADPADCDEKNCINDIDSHGKRNWGARLVLLSYAKRETPRLCARARARLGELQDQRRAVEAELYATLDGTFEADDPDTRNQRGAAAALLQICWRTYWLRRQFCAVRAKTRASAAAALQRIRQRGLDQQNALKERRQRCASAICRWWRTMWRDWARRRESALLQLLGRTRAQRSRLIRLGLGLPMRDHSNSHYTTTSYGLADDNVNAAEAVNKDRGDAAVKAEVDRIDTACASCNAFALVPLASKQSSLASTAGFEQSTQQPAEAGPWWLCVHCSCDVCWGAELGANLRQAVKREKDSEVQRRREVRRREQRRLSAPVLLPRRRASSPIRKKIKDGTHDAVGALTHKILTSCKSRSLHLRYWQRRLRELHIVAIQRVIRLRLLRVYHLPRAAGWSKTLQRARDDYDEERFAVTHVCQWRSAVFGQVCGKTGFYSAADVRKHYEEHEAEQRRQEMKVQKGFARLEAEREFLSQLRDKRKTMLRSSKQANSIAKAKIIEGRRAEGAQDMCRRVGVLEKLVGGNHAQMWQPVWRRFIIRLGKGVLELEPEHVCHRPDGDHGHDAAGISRRVTIMLSRGDTLVSHLSDVARRRFRRDFAFEVVTKQVQVDTDSGTTTDGAGGVERAVILAASSAEQARSWTADILQAMATPPHGALPGFLPGVWRAAQRGDVNTLQVWAIKGGAELLTRPNAHNCTPLFYAALSIAAAVDKCCCCGIDGDGTSDCASFAGKGFGDLCAVRRSVAAMELILDHAPEADPRQSNGTGHSAQSVLESCTSRLSKKQKDCEGLVTAAVTGVLQAASSACYGALECCRKRAQKLHQQQPSSTGITTYNGPACCTQSTSAIEAAPFAAQHGAEMLSTASATSASPQIDTAQKTITTLGLPREAMRKPVCGRAFELEPFDRTSQQKPAAAVQRLTRPLSAGVFRSASSHVPAQQPLPAHASVAPMHIETVMCRADVVAAFDGSIARAGVHAAENRARQELRAGLEVLEQQATTQKQSATRAWRRPRSATLWRSPGNDPNWQPQEFSGAPAAMAFTKPAGDAAQAHWRRAPFDSKPRGVKGDARAVLAQMRPGGTERRALLHMSSAQKRKFFDRKLAERAHMVKATAPPPLDPHEGDAVECRWRGKKKWYPAVVLADRSDGKFDVKFEDGEIERGVVAMCLRRRNNAGSRQQAYWYRVTGDSMPATVHDTGTTPGREYQSGLAASASPQRGRVRPASGSRLPHHSSCGVRTGDADGGRHVYRPTSAAIMRTAETVNRAYYSSCNWQAATGSGASARALRDLNINTNEN